MCMCPCESRRAPILQVFVDDHRHASRGSLRRAVHIRHRRRAGFVLGGSELLVSGGVEL